jgi:exoribonuclease R
LILEAGVSIKEQKAESEKLKEERGKENRKDLRNLFTFTID